MITYAEIMPLLLQACPTFNTTWDAHLEYWGEHEPGIYNDTAEFVYYPRRLSAARGHSANNISIYRGRTATAQGDAQTQEIATLGIIETLQNVASHSGAAEFYLPFLGPKTRDAWVTLNQYWARLMSSKAPRRKGSS